jgi:predicted pyridoxine 5'-phosphate oxidase superfamily flavin-nucleotide-binding protein
MASELADVARSVIDANSYMALGTADGAGNPWVSPVWFASED